MVVEPAWTWATNLTVDPAWIAPLLVRSSLTWSGGGGAGVLDELGSGVAGVVGVELVDGDDDGAVGVGVGVGVTAKATGAVPLTRTKPAPTLMISGLRTDRASTAYNLLNDRLQC
jgi:hypothetical protein